MVQTLSCSLYCILSYSGFISRENFFQNDLLTLKIKIVVKNFLVTADTIYARMCDY